MHIVVCHIVTLCVWCVVCGVACVWCVWCVLCGLCHHARVNNLSQPKQKTKQPAFVFIKDKGGSRAQPDLPGPWELVAQSAEEFRSLGATWAASRNRGERDLGEWVQEQVLPLLAMREEEEERRQRRQQRLRRQIGSNAAAVAAPLGERRCGWLCGVHVLFDATHVS